MPMGFMNECGTFKWNLDSGIDHDWNQQHQKKVFGFESKMPQPELSHYGLGPMSDNMPFRKASECTVI